VLSVILINSSHLQKMQTSLG